MDHKLFELVLVVKDIEPAARFYREAIGLEPIKPATHDWASFWAGERNTNAWLGLRKGTLLYEEHSPLPQGRRFGPIHFALRVPATAKAESLDRLARHGVKVYGPEIWQPGRFEGESYYCYDPDANLVELWFPSPPPTAEPARSVTSPT